MSVCDVAVYVILEDEDHCHSVVRRKFFDWDVERGDLFLIEFDGDTVKRVIKDSKDEFTDEELKECLDRYTFICPVCGENITNKVMHYC